MTLLPTDVVELAAVERSGFIESRHLGAAVLLAPDGAVERELGNVRAPVFPRSSLKPIQAAVSVALADRLDGPALGLATASHTGTDRHADVVVAMLAAGGLTAEDLRCPPSLPSDPAAKRAFIQADQPPDRLRMNCSGKHAAMLRACVAQGWPTASYLDPGHPLQRAIRAQLEFAAGEPAGAVGVDGCGAPIFAISLLGLARAIQWAARGLGASSSSSAENDDDATAAAARVLAQVMANPWTIQGEGRENSIVIEELGVFAKGGAEGVLVLAAPDGHVVALKVLDGSPRATSLIGIELLVAAGAVTRADADRAEDRLDLVVRGGGEPVGRIRAAV